MTQREALWWGVLGVYLLFVVEQAVDNGMQELVHPLPFPVWVSNCLFAFIAVWSLTGCLLYARNLYRYHDRFNYQERFFRRGAILVMLGGAMGYATRIFAQDATVTYSTPLIVIGYTMFIYAVTGSPVRQTTEDAVIAKLREEVENDGGPR